MYCSTCGKGLEAEKAQFCPSCGAKLMTSAAPTAPPAPQYDYIPTQSPARTGNAFGAAGLVVGSIALMLGLYDYSLVAGTYDYFVPEEIGILFAMSTLGLVLSAVGVSRKSSIGTWGLVFSSLSLILTFYLASLG
jgi:hypothetical protein